jgi:cytoskeletal protein CcmA (bactofilin family)
LEICLLRLGAGCGQIAGLHETTRNPVIERNKEDLAMWGQKDEPAAPSSPTPRPESQRMTSAAPPPRPAAPPPTAARPTNPGQGNAAQLGKSLKVKGEIAGSEDLYIDGEVEGKITLQGNNLTIGPNGNVRAEVTAQSITILGRLEGNVRAADRVEIRKTGSLEGDLVTARIAIEEDAVFRGSIDIVKPGAKQGDTAANAASGEKAKAAKSSSPS